MRDPLDGSLPPRHHSVQYFNNWVVTEEGTSTIPALAALGALGPTAPNLSPAERAAHYLSIPWLPTPTTKHTTGATFVLRAARTGVRCQARRLTSA
jgi:hypothetical protein